MRHLTIFWGCVAGIILNQVWLAIYDFLYTTKASFYTGESGVYSILTTLFNVLLLVVGVIFLLIGGIQHKTVRSNYFKHFCAAIAVILVVYSLGNVVWRYSLQVNSM